MERLSTTTILATMLRQKTVLEAVAARRMRGVDGPLIQPILGDTRFRRRSSALDETQLRGPTNLEARLTGAMLVNTDPS